MPYTLNISLRQHNTSGATFGSTVTNEKSGEVSATMPAHDSAQRVDGDGTPIGREGDREMERKGKRETTHNRKPVWRKADTHKVAVTHRGIVLRALSIRRVAPRRVYCLP